MFNGLGLHFQSLQRSSSLTDQNSVIKTSFKKNELENRMRIMHTMNALAGGKSRGQTGDGQAALKRIDKGQNGGLAMH